jgi:hypothetical protein
MAIATAGVLMGAAAASADPSPPPPGSATITVTIPGGGLAHTGGSGGHHGSGGTSTPPPGDSGAPAMPSVPSHPSVTPHTLELNHSRVHAGDTIIATGRGFAAGEKVLFVLYPGPLIEPSFAADAAGTVTARILLPRNIQTGGHTVQAMGWSSSRVASARFTVVTASASGSVESPWVGWIIACGALLVSIIAVWIASALGWLPKFGLRLATAGRG